MPKAPKTTKQTMHSLAGVKGDNPSRPTIPPKMAEYAKKWWSTTEDQPTFEAAEKQWREMQKILLPWKSDVSDVTRGSKPQELQNRADNRRVNLPLAFGKLMQSVAMLCPEDHSAKWVPREQVPKMDEVGKAQPISVDANLLRFSRTLEITTKHYLDEINIQDILEGFAQDVGTFPLAVLKCYFDRGVEDDPLQSSRGSSDDQDKIKRYRYLRTSFQRGDFNRDTADFQEMSTLHEAMGGNGELRLWQRLVVNNLEMRHFRIDRQIRSLDAIYDAEYMSEDFMLPISAVKTRYPYKELPGGKWKGIHPDDFGTCTRYDSYGKRAKDIVPVDRTSSLGIPRRTDRGSRSDEDNFLVLVREIWSKREGRVIVLVEGVEYPAASWVPKRQGEQWYPYIIHVGNRLFGSVYGISDVGLMAGIQNRINRKRTDEEKARWLCQPRYVYNSGDVDNKEIIKFNDLPPFQARGINIKGNGHLKDNIQEIKYTMDPKLFDTSADEADMDRVSNISRAADGLAGGPDSAKLATVQRAADAGQAVQSSFKQNRFRRTLDRFYTLIGDILLQELSLSDVQLVAGPNAIWPKMYTDSEAKALGDKITAAAMVQAVKELMPHLGVNDQGQMTDDTGNLITDDHAAEAVKKRALDIAKPEMISNFDFPEPMTRTVLYRRLRCKVEVALNSKQDKSQQVKDMLAMAQGMGEMAQAAKASGCGFNPAVYLEKVGTLLGEDVDLDEMFPQDPNQQVASGLQMLAGNPGQLNPQVAQMIVQAAQKIMQLAAGQQQPPPGGQPGPNAGSGPGQPQQPPQGRQAPSKPPMMART